MSIIYIEGHVGVTQFEQRSREEGFDPHKVVFLFPGNRGHHTTGTTLFSIKSGGGLAMAAAALGSKGFPVLSLPTTGMERWETDPEIKETVDGAIADLYRAAGAGFHLMLPVRPHTNTNYFKKGLEKPEDMEPSFWGENARTPNFPLADYYIHQLNLLNQFLALPEEDKERDNENVFSKYYLEGKTMLIENHPWIQAPIGRTQSAEGKIRPRMAAVKKEENISSSDSDDVSDANETSLIRPVAVSDTPQISEKTTAAYERLYSNAESPLSKARELLLDYTKNNSLISRFFHAHWGRHHVREVNELVQKIDLNVIDDVDMLLEELDKIKPINPEGSLARRIAFIKMKNQAPEPEQSPDFPSPF